LPPLQLLGELGGARAHAGARVHPSLPELQGLRPRAAKPLSRTTVREPETGAQGALTGRARAPAAHRARALHAALLRRLPDPARRLDPAAVRRPAPAEP